MPTGRLIRNTTRQPRSNRFASISMPPSTGPAIAASPPIMPNSAMRETRSSGANRTWTMAIAWGAITAPVALQQARGDQLGAGWASRRPPRPA
jgi:hypothetical protein